MLKYSIDHPVTVRVLINTVFMFFRPLCAVGILSLLFWVTLTARQYPQVTIHDIQFVPTDSLTCLDNSTCGPTAQYSSYYGDTLTVVAQCIVSPRVLNNLSAGYSMLLADTGSYGAWGGVLVKASVADTFQLVTDSFLVVRRGDLVRMTCRVDEYASVGNSVTQLVPIPGNPIVRLGNLPLPQPIQKSALDFHSYVGGEPFEGSYVLFTNVYVYSVAPSSGTFVVIDGAGHALQTINFLNNLPYWPPVESGDILDTLMGFVFPNFSGNEIFIGRYRIAPVYPSDIVIAPELPTIGSAQRTPIIVSSSVSPEISVRVTQGTNPIDSVMLIYSVNWNPFQQIVMSLDSADTLYKGFLPQQNAESFVHYFVKAVDNTGHVKILASYALGSVGEDTAKGSFFYTVLNRLPTIHDIQYTPFSNGYSGYASAYPNGATVTLSGIVTADSSDFNPDSTSRWSATAYYIQSGNEPWSGLWITGQDSIMSILRRGDSVSVTGVVQEWYGWVGQTTRLGGISSVIIHSSGNQLPEPCLRPTGDFGLYFSSDSLQAEPFEGMLVKFINTRVTNTWPYFSDPTLYELSDGTGGGIIGRDGKNSYSNIPDDANQGYTILYVGDKISELNGVVHYAGNHYVVMPRTNTDFKGVGWPQSVHEGWNMLSLPRQTASNMKNAIYPTSTSDAHAFLPYAGYVIAESLFTGNGYWLKFDTAQTILILGLKKSTDTIDVQKGWNLIGAMSDSVNVSGILTEPPNIIVSQFFGYEGSYGPATTLFPGKAYWVKVNQNGKLIMVSLSQK